MAIGASRPPVGVPDRAGWGSSEMNLPMRSLHVSGRQLAAFSCAAAGLMVMGSVLSGHQAWLRLLPSSSPPVFNLGVLFLLSARLVRDSHRRPNLGPRLAALAQGGCPGSAGDANREPG